MAQINTVLIANRGEIAVRVIRTARAMGYRTVAVYSEADAGALHVTCADSAVAIGPAPVGQSYLDGDRILEAARKSGADAIHPGYGFLSENAGFAQDCARAGITFVGPPPEAIALMGSKRLSKAAMIKAGVPCIAGYQGAAQSDARLLQEAEKIGFPLMVKASAGGGGRGMRLVQGLDDLPGALIAARSEALAGFGDDELILERAILDPRHIEVQVFADAHGNVVHLGERDCSVQRRHQKVIEEAPSPFVTPALRAAMGAAAIKAARACDYRGAGTVEFLVDGDGGFHFLEMNTRLQVEHPVSEAITGQDLVEWQFRVAAGEALPLAQEEITLSGWAMEVRLYGEDPQRGFLPQTGQIAVWEPASGPGIRVDHGLRQGQQIGAHYDPMLAKIIATGPNRDATRQRLIRAVDDTVLLGITTNQSFLSRVLRHPGFADGSATTGFLAAHPCTAPAPDDAADPNGPDPAIETWALAAMLFHARATDRIAMAPAFRNWSNGPPTPALMTLDSGGSRGDMHLTALPATDEATRYAIGMGAQGREIMLLMRGDTSCTCLIDGVRRVVRFAFGRDGGLFLQDPATGARVFRDIPPGAEDGAGVQGTGTLVAPMDGAIVALRVRPGDRVAQGQVVVALDAMKMEHHLGAGMTGEVEEVCVAEGDQVKTGQVLLRIAPDA